MTKTLASYETHAGAQHFCRTIRSVGRIGPGPRVFVAGCGRGHEALFIRRELGGSLVGVDIDQTWEPAFGADVPDFQLLTGSILDLPFSDDSFDAVFYHHVIEHVSDPAGSLRELARILRPGGLIYVGTPNRHRVVGYLGSFDATAMQKLRWNLSEYRARLTNRFRNEFGVHAGFSERELHDLWRRISSTFVSLPTTICASSTANDCPNWSWVLCAPAVCVTWPRLRCMPSPASRQSYRQRQRRINFRPPSVVLDAAYSRSSQGHSLRGGRRLWFADRSQGKDFSSCRSDGPICLETCPTDSAMFTYLQPSAAHAVGKAAP